VGVIIISVHTWDEQTQLILIATKKNMLGQYIFQQWEGSKTGVYKKS
jgi:hypothetical protein